MPQVIYKPAGKDPVVVEWSDLSLDRYQEALDGGTLGQAMTYRLGNINWVCYCDDDGLLKNLEYNFSRPTDKRPIVGPVFFVGRTGHDDRGLTDEEINHIMDGLKNIRIVAAPEIPEELFVDCEDYIEIHQHERGLDLASAIEAVVDHISNTLHAMLTDRFEDELAETETRPESEPFTKPMDAPGPDMGQEDS